MDDPIEITPFFLPLIRVRLFCIYLAPKTGKPSAGILYLHPFAEEMHKARHMATMQARRLAEKGYAVLMVDLPGCGDSTGDFADAEWQQWKQCAKAGIDWLEKKIEGQAIFMGFATGCDFSGRFIHSNAEPSWAVVMAAHHQW